MRRASRAVLLAVAALAAGAPAHAEPASAASAASATTAAAWMPLAVGQERSYRAHWDYFFQPAGGSAVRRFSLGWIRERVVAEGPLAAAAGAHVFRVLQETEEKSMEGGAIQRSQETFYLASGPEGAFRLEPRGKPGSEAAWPAFREPPLRFLPASPRVGQTWQAGLLHEGDMSAALRGEIVGAEDLTLGGRLYPGCLHVRLTGEPRGSSRVGGRPLRIEGGRFEQEFWLARGHGMLKAVVRSELDLAAEDGSRLKSSGVWTSYLSPEPAP